MSHFAEAYLNKPWVNRGRGPDAFDCWGLVMHIYQQRYNIRLKELGVDAKDLRAVITAAEAYCMDWMEVDAPEEGDVVLLGQATRPTHVGLWVESVRDRGVLHCKQGTGVIFTPAHDLLRQGWSLVSYYRWPEAYA